MYKTIQAIGVKFSQKILIYLDRKYFKACIVSLIATLNSIVKCNVILYKVWRWASSSSTMP